MPSTTNAALALLDSLNGDLGARWNFPAVVGRSADSGAGFGQGVDISVSFLSSLPAHSVGSIAGFQQFSSAQMTAARSVLASIEGMIDVDFTVLKSGLGQITFGNSYQAQGTAGFAYSPSYSYMSLRSRVTSVSEVPSAGDVWIERIEAWDADAWTPGQDGYHTLLHEVGHALGLKHPFEGQNWLPAPFDNERYTVMSYTQAAGVKLVEVTGSPSGYAWQTSSLRPSTLMPMDLEALQFLYGANTATRAGDTTYRWDTNAELLETIWDAGGTDTIDCANQVFSCVIDLRDNTFSSIAVRQTAQEIKAGLGLPDWFPAIHLPADIYDGTDNVAIARGVVIENATGGSAADSITGNAAANVLAGSGGNDTLSGGNGNDTLNGGSGADSMSGGRGDDTYVVDSSGDTVRESSGSGADRVLSHLAGYTLGANVEDGRILSAGTANMAGNALANTILAGTGHNTLAGGDGIDTVSYASGADSKGVTVSLAIATAQATGGSGTDRLSGFENLTGSAAGDKLTGSAGANRLAGAAGNDQLSGGAGNDTLVGGAGRDTLSGGSGNDIFDFDLFAEMGTDKSSWDILADFARGQDDIDLSTLDARAGTAANEAFSFVGTRAFSAAGQVRYVYDSGKGYGVLYGNTDADAQAEFALQLTGVTSLSASDLIA